MAGLAVQSLAIATGVGATIVVVSNRLRVPPILPLLLAGFAIGKVGIVDSDSLEAGLLAIVSISVALLIFEGSLHLDRDTLHSSPKAVQGLLTIGAVITWVLAALAARFVMKLPWDLSILLGAMLIVTGPTVIQPILRRVPLKPNLHAALMAEGILIDPIGVIAAVATLELVIARHFAGADETGFTAALLYVKPLVAGTVFGVASGWLGKHLINRVPTASPGRDRTIILIGIACCMTSVGLSELAAPEAGLVAATLCGLIMVRAKHANVEPLQHFAINISTVMLGSLFILLASRFEVERLFNISWREIVFVALLILVVRPVSALGATVGSALSIRERWFIAFLAPRGIVAAMMASIVALQFSTYTTHATSHTDAEAITGHPAVSVDQATLDHVQNLETVVVLVIFVTVLLGGTLASPVATLLKVRAGKPNGVVIIGAHQAGRELAKALRDAGVPVRLLDSNAANIAEAAEIGLPATRGNATDLRWLESQASPDRFGWLLSITDNAELDHDLARWGAQRFGSGRGFIWSRKQPESGSSGVVFPWGRPLRHLLFQFDLGLARIKAFEADNRKGINAPLVTIAPNGDTKVVQADADLDDIPEDYTIIGLAIGPPDDQ
ncbi:MAG: cation:proton antiporter [Phycisphaeraceae bacterium]|nr:cation:proton antiporter [Phycisphaerales bacterium]MCB9860922.1 cation:proton antiporter [Phycisphaeraceae bacterium]